MSLTQHLWSQLTGGAVLPPKPAETPTVIIPKPVGIYALESPDGVEVWHHDDTGYWQHVGTVRTDEGFTDDELAAYLKVRGGHLDLLVKHREADM